MSIGSCGLATIVRKNPDDIVVSLAVHTSSTVNRDGASMDSRFLDVISSLLEAVKQKSNLDPRLIGGVCLANTSNHQNGWPVLRYCLTAAGFPENLSAYTVSGPRRCGLKAAQDIATQIRNGNVDVGIVMGADCTEQGRDASDLVRDNLEKAQNYSLRNEEITPCIAISDTCDRAKTGHIMQGNGKGKQGFESVTCEGAALLLMKRFKAQSLQLPIQAKFFAAAMSGLGPSVKDVGPCLAISKALSQCMIGKDVVDMFEIDEESQASVTYCVTSLHLDPAKVNMGTRSASWGQSPAVIGLKQVMSGLCEARTIGAQIVMTAVPDDVGRGMAGIWVNEMGF